MSYRPVRGARAGDLIGSRQPGGASSSSALGGAFRLYVEAPFGERFSGDVRLPAGTLLFVLAVDGGAMLVLSSSGALGWVVLDNPFVRFDIIARAPVKR